jgi:hypothetical protein
VGAPHDAQVKFVALRIVFILIAIAQCFSTCFMRPCQRGFLFVGHPARSKSCADTFQFRHQFKIVNETTELDPRNYGAPLRGSFSTIPECVSSRIASRVGVRETLNRDATSASSITSPGFSLPEMISLSRAKRICSARDPRDFFCMVSTWTPLGCATIPSWFAIKTLLLPALVPS